MSLCLAILTANGLLISADGRGVVNGEDGKYIPVTDYAKKLYQINNNLIIFSSGYAELTKKVINSLKNKNTENILKKMNVEEIAHIISNVSESMYQEFKSEYSQITKEYEEEKKKGIGVNQRKSSIPLNFLVFYYDSEKQKYYLISISNDNDFLPDITSIKLGQKIIGGIRQEEAVEILRRNIPSIRSVEAYSQIFLDTFRELSKKYVEVGGKITMYLMRNDEIMKIENHNYNANTIINYHLVSKNGNVILDEDGIMQTDTIQEADNVDSSHPLILRFMIDDDVIRIQRVRLAFSLEKFRAYSTGASSGGASTITSASGGGSTETSSEDVYHLYTTTVPDVLSWDGDHVHSLSSAGGHTHKYTYQKADGTWIDAYTSTDGNHTHDMSIDGGHTHAILSQHTHDVTIPNHSHTVSIPNHTHDIIYGIYESTMATGVKVKIDGIERLNNGGVGYSTNQANLDLTQWITTPGWHTIELTSTQLGRINASLYVKSFVKSY